MHGRRHKGELGVVPADTEPAAWERYCQLLRARAPHERLAQAVALSRAARELAIAGINQRHPTATQDEIRVRLAVLLYGREVAQRVFGRVPSDAG